MIRALLLVALVACAHAPPKAEAPHDATATLTPVYVFGRAGQKPPEKE